MHANKRSRGTGSTREVVGREEGGRARVDARRIDDKIVRKRKEASKRDTFVTILSSRVSRERRRCLDCNMYNRLFHTRGKMDLQIYAVRDAPAKPYPDIRYSR